MKFEKNNRPGSSILKSVSKPGRYCGGEYGSIIKDKESIKARFAFCFPDSYEIGMSNLGVRILYGALNEEKDIWCERVYAPWVDMEEKMRTYDIPLTAHESGDAVRDFDIVGFTLQYEMCYTNVLNMLDLMKVPLRSADRGEDEPIIIGGGPCAYNPEPIAPFFDVFSIGEGEEALVEFTKLYIKMKEDGSYTRAAFLRKAANIEGVYIPSLYGILEGRDFTTDPMNLNVDLPNSDGSGYILVRFDTTTDNIISIVSELAPYTPVYDDINAGGTVCEMILATYTATPTQVSTITMTYSKANFGGKMEGTLNTGDTSISFQNPLFSNDTYFDIYTDSSDVVPRSWSFAGTTLTITFFAQNAAHKIGVVYKNFN